PFVPLASPLASRQQEPCATTGRRSVSSRSIKRWLSMLPHLLSTATCEASTRYTLQRRSSCPLRISVSRRGTGASSPQHKPKDSTFFLRPFAKSMTAGSHAGLSEALTLRRRPQLLGL